MSMINLSAPQNILDPLERILLETKPISIFLYGSRARNDFLDRSDYEIGVLYEKELRPSRIELESLYDQSMMRVYPFVYEDFMAGNPDTPFPKQHYLFELSRYGKIIAGKNVFNRINPVLISQDLVELVYFELGYAVSAMLSYRNDDQITASTTFHKSVLFGARAYLYAAYGQFPGSYSEIANAFVLHAKDIDPKYIELTRNAIQVRSGEQIDKAMLYTNISFLNKLVLPIVKGMES